MKLEGGEVVLHATEGGLTEVYITEARFFSQGLDTRGLHAGLILLPPICGEAVEGIAGKAGTTWTCSALHTSLF